MHILDTREVVLRKQKTFQIKVEWDHYAPDQATWEMEDAMRQAYPFLFQEFSKDA